VDAFPKVDVFAELSEMAAWWDANPKKRKKDGKRCAAGRISRESQQERGVSQVEEKINTKNGKNEKKSLEHSRRLHSRFYEVRKLQGALLGKTRPVRDL